MWDAQSISVLEKTMLDRYIKFKMERLTDPKNLSVLWNFHLKELGITGVRPKGKRPLFVNDIVNLINFRNDEVSGSVCVRNPDRTSQFLLVPRDVAEKILVLGMP